MLKLFYKISLIGIIILSATLLYQKHTYAYHTLTRIDPLPHIKELVSQHHYVDAQEYLEYFMQFEYVNKRPEVEALFKSIKAKRSSVKYRSAKIFEGISTGTSDEIVGQLSAIGSDFFIIGDLRDLAIEGSHYYKDEKVDKVLISLSTIGLVASASTFFTFGAVAPAKGSVSVLKLAHKSNKVPTWLRKYLVGQTKQIRKTKSIDTVKPLLKSIADIKHEVGLKNTLKILSKSKNIGELKAMSKLSKHYGKNTALMLKLSNAKLLTHTDTLRHYNKSTVKLASIYGENGFTQLLKGGEKHFLKTTKRMKAYAKLGYKGEAWKVLLWLMKHLNDTILIVMLSIASLLLLPFRKLKNLKRFF